MKKLLLIAITASVLLSTVAAAAPLSTQSAARQLPHHMITPIPADVSIYEDVVDQAQTTNYTGNISVGYVNFYGFHNLSVAQSFIPTKKILTRVQIYSAKNPNSTMPCVLAIRSNLTGENLAYATMNPQAFPDYPSFDWVEFNFDDIPITINTTYYLVLWTDNATGNYYYASGSDGNPYPNGSAYYTINNGQNWSLLGNDGDAAFQTYGRDAPSWATGMYSGVWGLCPAGIPLPPSGWFTGFTRQRFLLGYDGIFAPFNTPIHNATNGLTGVVFGPFMIGAIKNLTTGKAAWFVSLGSGNATTSEFYFRLMFFVGPTFYMSGKYYTF